MRTTPLSRNTERVLDDTQIVKLYNEVLIPFETDNIDLSGYSVDSRNIKQLKKDLMFDFSPNGEIKTDDEAQIDIFYLKPYKSHSLPASLWVRVRNALAHNRIFHSESGEIILEDERYGKLTMFAKVSSIEKLIKIIEGIQKSK